MKHYEQIHNQEFDKSALKVNKGIEKPPVVNPYFNRKERQVFTVEQYVKGIVEQNITIISQAITLIESSLPQHQNMAQQIIERCLPHSGNSIRIGITGVPGAGKSTFIEAIGGIVVQKGCRLAVLAIDPSSELSKGSILGDKTRMETIVHNKDVFIRPSPSSGSLGGVARKTRETIIICEASGFDVIFVETVGVGQSEIAVHSMVDLFLLLQISGAGDELQGIKRGIMEMADMVTITKADGTNKNRANLAKSQIENALALFPLPDSGFKPKVYTTSAIENNGIVELWEKIEEFLHSVKQNEYFYNRRSKQSKYWMFETIDAELKDNFYLKSNLNELIRKQESAILNNEKSSFVAATELLDRYFKEMVK